MEADWREARRAALGGVTLHVVEAGPEDGPPIILLHGFPDFWWGWRRQIGPLAAEGYRVIAPDMRGFGRSDVPAALEAYHLDVLADDVVALADSSGVGRFRLAGHDWGAIVAWWTAARHPERVERMVVMDGPHPDVWRPQALRHPTQALRSTYVALFQLPWVPEAVLRTRGFAVLRGMVRGMGRSGTFSDTDLDRYAAEWARPGVLTAMLNYYRALRLRSATREASRIAPPTLVLWGGLDPTLERHVAEAGAALCDDGRLEVLPEAMHWVQLEEPGRVNTAILAFLHG